MVSYINTPANSILSLDDSTKLNASGKVNLNAVSENYISSINGGGKSFGAEKRFSDTKTMDKFPLPTAIPSKQIPLI